MNPEPITDAELEVLEHDVLTALTTGDATRLTLLGEGEISLVLAGGEDRSWACKRLPPFTDTEAAERYAATFFTEAAVPELIFAITMKGRVCPRPFARASLIRM